MTSKDNPRQPDDETLGEYAERVLPHRMTISEMADELRDALAKYEELSQRHATLGLELTEARGAAVIANRRRSELGAELATAQERIRALEAENTKLHGQLNALAQRRDPPGSYLIRSPGVYYAFMGDFDRELHVVKHDAEDTIYANVNIHAGWNYIGRDLHGDPLVMRPGQEAQQAIDRVVTPDGVVKPFGVWGIDPGKGDDLTTVGLREQIMQPGLMAKVGIDPGNGDDLTTVMQTTLTRLARLEAWARQFDIGHFELAGVKPLDRVEPKA